MLVRCEECGGVVSDRAESCPHCGMPRIRLRPRMANEADEDVVELLPQEQKSDSAVARQVGLVIQRVCALCVVLIVTFLLLLGHSFVYMILAPSCYDPIIPCQMFLSRGVFLILPWTFCRPLLSCIVAIVNRSGAYYTGKILTGLMWLFAIFVPIFNFEFGFAESIWANVIGVIISVLAIGSLRRYVKRLAVVRGEKNDEGQMSNNVEEKVVSHTDVKNGEPTDAAQGDEEAMKELERIKEYAARRGAGM